MKLFYSMHSSQCPFLLVSSFVSKSDNIDDALKELMESTAKTNQGAVSDDVSIHRVIAHDDNKSEKPSEEELRWLSVVSPRWDVEWPKTAVYYHLYGRTRYFQTSDGQYEWKLGDE